MHRALKFAFGVLHMPPREVWSMTVCEYDAAIDGYLESQGVDPTRASAAMTRARLDELKRLYPDG